MGKQNSDAMLPEVPLRPAAAFEWAPPPSDSGSERRLQASDAGAVPAQAVCGTMRKGTPKGKELHPLFRFSGFAARKWNCCSKWFLHDFRPQRKNWKVLAFLTPFWLHKKNPGFTQKNEKPPRASPCGRLRSSPCGRTHSSRSLHPASILPVPPN